MLTWLGSGSALAASAGPTPPGAGGRDEEEEKEALGMCNTEPAWPGEQQQAPRAADFTTEVFGHKSQGRWKGRAEKCGLHGEK